MSLADTFLPVGYLRRSSRARTTRPPRFVVLPMRLTMVSNDRSGRPRQFIVMNENRRCIGIPLRAHPLPPSLDRCHGEHRRVVVGADVDEAVVRRDIVDAVRDRLADGVVGKVVDVDQLGLALRLPVPPGILEVADQLLLLGIDGDERHATVEAVLRLLVDVLELRIAIGMLGALDGLARRLEAVAVGPQQAGHGLVADAEAIRREHLRRERARALGRPAQRRFWVATRDRVDELFERRYELWVRDFVEPTAATLATNVDDVGGAHPGADLIATERDGADREPSGACNGGDPAPPERLGLGTRPQPTRTFIHRRLQKAPLPTNQSLRIHSGRRSRQRDRVDPLSTIPATTSDRLVHTRALSHVRVPELSVGFRESRL